MTSSLLAFLNDSLSWIVENAHWLFSGLGVAVLLTFLKVFRPQGSKPRAGLQEESGQTRSTTGTDNTLALVKFATGNELEQHRRMLGSVEEKSQQYALRGVADTGTWTVVAQWDASHDVPSRGDGQGVNPPVLVEWSPNGKDLVTACDAFGLTRWTREGRRKGGGTPNTAYGQPIRIFWSPDGKLALLEAITGLNHWWSIHDDHGNLIHQMVGYEGWGWDSLEIFGFNRTRLFSPWRPGHRQLLLNLHGAELDLYAISSFPESSRSTKTLRDVAPVDSVSLSSLGALDERIFRYSWHPSGQYVAVTTGTDDYNVRRVHVLHYDRREIVATIPSTTIGLGWSPGGRFFLCHRWTAPYTDDWSTDLGIWDAHSLEFRDLSEDERELPWVRRLDHCGRVTAQSAPSADGELLLHYHSKLEGTDDSPAVTSRNPTIVLAREGIAHAAWSPIHPRCFATVGGREDSTMLRIWELRG